MKPLGARAARRAAASPARPTSANRRTVLVLDVGAIIEEVVSGDARARASRGGRRSRPERG